MLPFADLWERLRFSQTQPPLAIAVAPDHVDVGETLGTTLKARESYFQVQVNQLFLSKSRKWFDKIEPMVLTLSEFNYAGGRSTVPFVVGPGKLKSLGVEKEPQGMLYSNTRVAGIHPFAGGPVAVAVVLCQVPVDDVADRFLRVVESTSQTFDFGSMLGPYVKVGRAVMDGINELFGLGSPQSLVGWRQHFDNQGGAPFSPGFFALATQPEGGPPLRQNALWVKDRRLHEGPSLAEAQPYRRSDFVLFSIAQPPDGRRDDLDQIPINALWLRVREEAVVTTDDGRKSFQANWTTLEQTILLSPDLTEGQKDALVDEYWRKASAERERALGRSFRDEAATDGLEGVRRRSLRAFAVTN